MLILPQISTNLEEVSWVSCLPFCPLAVFLPHLSSLSSAIAGVDEPVFSLALSSWRPVELYRGPLFTVSWRRPGNENFEAIYQPRFTNTRCLQLPCL